jgi:hypothetical protein
MPDSGADLGFELFELYRAGKQNLPNVAAEYHSAALSVASALSQASSAFTRPAQFGGAQGPAYGEWSELQQTIEKVLYETEDNMLDTGAALILAANTLAASDTDAKTALDKLKTDYGMA